MQKVVDTYGDKVRVVFRDYPLPFHRRARPAAEAAACANAQGKFWEYNKKLFANQTALSDDNFKTYAKDLGLDTAKFDECYAKKPFTRRDRQGPRRRRRGRRERHAGVLHQRPIAVGRAAVREVQGDHRRGAGGAKPAS